jgi:hypothetical protein
VEKIMTEVKELQAINLLELRPARNLEWVTLEDQRVTLLIPKFRNRFAAKWFLPLLAKPHFRLKLDAYGSFVWNLCDGETTVEVMGQRMSAQFGEAVDSFYERIGKFLQKLERENFLIIKK